MCRVRLEGLTGVTTVIHGAGLSKQHQILGNIEVSQVKWYNLKILENLNLHPPLLKSASVLQDSCLSPTKNASRLTRVVLQCICTPAHSSSSPPGWLQVNHYFLIADTLSLE